MDFFTAVILKRGIIIIHSNEIKKRHDTEILKHIILTD